MLRSLKSERWRVQHLVVSLLFLRFVEHVGEATLSAVLTIEVRRHEDASTALLRRALPPQPVDLAVIVNLVVLQHSQLNLAVLVLDLLGSGVILLLALLSSTPQPKNLKSSFLTKMVS